MWIIGCDFHPSGQQVYTVKEQTGEVVERWLSHGGEEVDQFYASVPAGSEVGVETSGFPQRCVTDGTFPLTTSAASGAVLQIRRHPFREPASELLSR